MRWTATSLSILFGSLLLACGTETPPSPEDAGSGDAGDAPFDAGDAPFDAGPGPGDDAGPGHDGGSADAGGGDPLPALGDATREVIEPRIHANDVAIAVGADGQPRIAAAGDDAIQLVTRSASGTWAVERVADGYFDVVLALAPDGTAHLVYDHFDRHPRYARRDPSGAITEVTIDVDADVRDHLAVAVEPSGDPFVAYLDRSTRALEVGTWNGSSFDVEAIDVPEGDTDQLGEFVAAAIAPDGTAHLVYLGAVGDARQLRHAERAGGAWTVEVVGVPQATGARAALALDAAGEPVVASAALVSMLARGLFLTTRGASGWSETELRPTSTPVPFLELALDAAERPHVLDRVESGATRQLRLLRLDGAARDEITFASADIPGPGRVAMALGADGLPHVATNDQDSSKRLVYYHFGP